MTETKPDNLQMSVEPIEGKPNQIKVSIYLIVESEKFASMSNFNKNLFMCYILGLYDKIKAQITKDIKGLSNTQRATEQNTQN